MIDSHCHLADAAFAEDLEAVVGRARAAGVERALCILDVTSGEEAPRADRVAGLWPAAGFAAGVHPHQAAPFAGDPDAAARAVRQAVETRPGVCAVGEVGLDYHYDFAPRPVQIELFRRQIVLARELDRPLVIHTREADEDTLAALRAEGGGEARGVFHCFTGDAVAARRVLDLGFHVSFSGIATFRRADDIRAAAAVVPADRLLVETDAPYLAPVPHRGQRNEPAWVARVVDVLAEVRKQPAADVAASSSAAFTALFGGALPAAAGAPR